MEREITKILVRLDDILVRIHDEARTAEGLQGLKKHVSGLLADKAIIVWTAEEILERSREIDLPLTGAEAKTIINALLTFNNPKDGINWDTIDKEIRTVFEDRRTPAEKEKDEKKKKRRKNGESW